MSKTKISTKLKLYLSSDSRRCPIYTIIRRTNSFGGIHLTLEDYIKENLDLPQCRTSYKRDKIIDRENKAKVYKISIQEV